MSARVFAGSRPAAVNDAGHVIGAAHPNAKLSDDDIELILALRDAGLSHAKIAAKFDGMPRVSRTMVGYVCRGERRQQTVMGHRLIQRNTRLLPADPSEFPAT